MIFCVSYVAGKKLFWIKCGCEYITWPQFTVRFCVRLCFCWCTSSCYVCLLHVLERFFFCIALCRKRTIKKIIKTNQQTKQPSSKPKTNFGFNLSNWNPVLTIFALKLPIIVICLIVAGPFDSVLVGIVLVSQGAASSGSYHHTLSFGYCWTFDHPVPWDTEKRLGTTPSATGCHRLAWLCWLLDIKYSFVLSCLVLLRCLASSSLALTQRISVDFFFLSALIPPWPKVLQWQIPTAVWILVDNDVCWWHWLNIHLTLNASQYNYVEPRMHNISHNIFSLFLTTNAQHFTQ
jgi:hypothetical protein